VKEGLIKEPGNQFAGRLFVGGIGLDPTFDELSKIVHEVIEPSLAQSWLPERPRLSHKGTFGRALIIAGSVNYPGATALAAKGAYRCGAGLVTLAVPEPIYRPLVSTITEATWIVLPHDQGVVSQEAVDILQPLMKDFDALLVGPGFGTEKSTERFIRKLFGAKRGGEAIGFVEHNDGMEPIGLPPLVLDADGLKLLKPIDQWYTYLSQGAVLTPHPGELSVLTGIPINEIQANRREIALEQAQAWGHILVLKGAHTLIAHPDGRSMVCPIATSALAKAGTGDVLAGVIVGLLAQGLEPYQAACLGVYLHARAGEIAADIFQTTASVLASDVADALADVFAELAIAIP
jgi:NAD(P)H-hydrate epimerase